jgi:hypothetical protein
MTKRHVPNWGVDALRTFRRFLKGRYHHGTAAFFEEGASDLEKDACDPKPHVHWSPSRCVKVAEKAASVRAFLPPNPDPRFAWAAAEILTASSADAQDHQT